MEAALVLSANAEPYTDLRARSLSMNNANTLIFASPEIRNMKNHGFTTDIWSLGILFNYILYETTSNLVEKNNCVDINVPNGTPNWLTDLLKSMLQYRP